MAWATLLIAGLLETAWAAGLKAVSERFSIGLLLATAALMITSLAALFWSMRSLPLGVAYPIWTGIGSIGSVVASILVFKEQIGATGLVGVTLLILGMILLGLETH